MVRNAHQYGESPQKWRPLASLFLVLLGAWPPWPQKSPWRLRNTRPASTSVSWGCSQHAREQRGFMAKTYCVLSASWVQERREREAERLCSERRAFASCRAQGASLPHCGDHAGRVPRGWRSSWEFPTEHLSNERHMASWMGAVLASCRPSQPWFNQWCESSNWSPSPGKLTCSIEIAESGSCFFCQFQASQFTLNTPRPSTTWQNVAERLLKPFDRFCWDSCLPCLDGALGLKHTVRCAEESQSMQHRGSLRVVL